MHEQRPLPTIFILSDSLGETAELVARAASSQFNGGAMPLRRIPYVETREEIETVLDEAMESGGLVVYTLILPELRAFTREQAEKRGVEAVDVMGPVMDSLARVCSLEPHLQPGLVHRLDEDYFRRVEAVEFAVKYDDGKDGRSLSRADVVLVGVSRSSKTPVSMYLAHRGYRVANVPLVPEVELPQELYRQPLGKVIGLTLRAEKLQEIRQERLRTIGLGSDSSYGDMDRIREELRAAQDLFRELGCPVIDVSSRAVEETANKVLEILRNRGRIS